MWIDDEKVQVVCKKEIKGMYYFKGELHDAHIEVFEKWVGIWIDQKRPGYEGKFGGRFAVEGNVYHDGKPYWHHYREYFYDIKSWERIQKLNKLKNL